MNFLKNSGSLREKGAHLELPLRELLLGWKWPGERTICGLWGNREGTPQIYKGTQMHACVDPTAE